MPPIKAFSTKQCGKAGLRELRSRLLKWRVGARWYVAALLIAPALMTALDARGRTAAPAGKPPLDLRVHFRRGNRCQFAADLGTRPGGDRSAVPRHGLPRCLCPAAHAYKTNARRHKPHAICAVHSSFRAKIGLYKSRWNKEEVAPRHGFEPHY